MKNRSEKHPLICLQNTPQKCGPCPRTSLLGPMIIPITKTHNETVLPEVGGNQ